jgi:hypothetical protein
MKLFSVHRVCAVRLLLGAGGGLLLSAAFPTIGLAGRPGSGRDGHKAANIRYSDYAMIKAKMREKVMIFERKFLTIT